MSTNNQCLDILKIEYTQVCSKLLYLDDQANKYVSYMLTTVGVLAAFLSVLIKNGKPTDFITFSLLISAGTLIIGLLIIMTLHHTIQCFRLGGYIKYLESEINAEANCDLLKWETKVASKYVHKDITTYLIYSIMGLVFFILLFSAAYVSVLYILPQWPFITVMTFGIIMLEIISGVIYLRKVSIVHEEIYKELKESGDSSEPNKENEQ